MNEACTSYGRSGTETPIVPQRQFQTFWIWKRAEAFRDSKVRDGVEAEIQNICPDSLSAWLEHGGRYIVWYEDKA